MVEVSQPQGEIPPPQLGRQFAHILIWLKSGISPSCHCVLLAHLVSHKQRVLVAQSSLLSWEGALRHAHFGITL